MDSDDDDRFEAAPLLGREDRDDPEDVAARSNGNGSASSTRLPRRQGFAARFQAQKPRTIVLLLAILMFIFATSGMMIMVPIFRIVEDAVCHVYYKKDRSEVIEERLCKVEGVQRQLAYFGGIVAMLNTLIGMMAALPYGVLADKIGRKYTFGLAYAGTILAIGWTPLMLAVVQTTNLYLLMFSPLFFLIGGGIPVALNSLNAMAADVSPAADRSTSFLYLSFGGVAAGMVGPVGGGILMEKISPWFPIILVFALTPLAFALLLFIPETLPIRLEDSFVVETDTATKRPVREAIDELLVSFTLLKNTNLILCMVAFFIHPALFAAFSGTVAQYVSTYFGWTLAQTSYLLAPPMGLLNLAVILLVPWVSDAVTAPAGRFGLPIFSKDLLLTKISLSFLAVGTLLQGFSQGVVLFIIGLAVGTVGAAHAPLLRAIATSYVEPTQTSRLYSLISILETIGAVIGGPVLAKLFDIGLTKRGSWIGLPWFYVAGLVILAISALMFVTPPKQNELLVEEEGNGNLGYQSADDQA